VKNFHGNGYSDEKISQETNYIDANTDEIDLDASDWMLYNDGDSMMEIKDSSRDIILQIKER
jgi:hypothetical protein